MNLKSTVLNSQVESHKTMCQFNSFVISIFLNWRKHYTVNAVVLLQASL